MIFSSLNRLCFMALPPSSIQKWKIQVRNGPDLGGKVKHDLVDAEGVPVAVSGRSEGSCARRGYGVYSDVVGWHGESMSIVDRAKALVGLMNDYHLPQRVVFHHVPKCGGTSVGRALRKRYITSQATVSPESSFRAFQTFTGRTDREGLLVDILDLREQMLLYLLYEDVRCVSAHVRFSHAAYDTFRDKYAFITILREPVQRFISHYFWSFQRPNAHGRIDEDFESFLETQRAKRLGASYVEYFCGLPKETDITTAEAVDSAIRNLRRMNIVGRLDDLAGFQADLRKTLGVRVRIGHENKMRQSVGREAGVVKPELMDHVRALCAPDIMVWNAVFSGCGEVKATNTSLTSTHTAPTGP
jgi:hypothetical protein